MMSSIETRRSSTGTPALWHNAHRTVTLSLPLAPNAGQYEATGSSRARTPRSSSRLAHAAVAPLVDEKTGTTVSCCQGAPVPGSATPPHRSTTLRPSTYTAQAAPTSPPFSKFRVNASATSSNPGSTSPATTPRMLLTNHVLRQTDSMEFAESEEHQLLRTTAAELAGRFGHDYFVRTARAGGKADELWQAFADHGLLGVHLPEQYGGGGAGITELAIVCEEAAAQGCPMLLILVSAAICAEVIARFGSEQQKQA